MPTNRVFVDEEAWKAARVNKPGKRPILDRKPVPWVAADGPAFGEWKNVDPDRSSIAEIMRLCIICGQQLPDDYVYSNFDGKPHDQAGVYEELIYDEKTDQIGFQRRTVPTATHVHPACALQAAAFCPHLQRMDYPAIDREGNPLSKSDLRKMVKNHADRD